MPPVLEGLRALQSDGARGRAKICYNCSMGKPSGNLQGESFREVGGTFPRDGMIGSFITIRAAVPVSNSGSGLTGFELQSPGVPNR